jgi:hypothetical protein
MFCRRTIFAKRNGKAYARNHDFGLSEICEAAGIERDGRLLYAFRHGFCVSLANKYYGDHWERAEARDMMRHKSDKTVEYYYRVLKHRLAEKAAQSVPLSNIADFSGFDCKDPSPKADGAVSVDMVRPFSNEGDLGGSERANPSESFLKRKGATRHGYQGPFFKASKRSTKTTIYE